MTIDEWAVAYLANNSPAKTPWVEEEMLGVIKAPGPMTKPDPAPKWKPTELRQRLP